MHIIIIDCNKVYTVHTTQVYIPRLGPPQCPPGGSCLFAASQQHFFFAATQQMGYMASYAAVYVHLRTLHARLLTTAALRCICSFIYAL